MEKERILMRFSVWPLKNHPFIRYIEIPRTFVRRPASGQFPVLSMILSVSCYPLYYSAGRIPVELWEDMLISILRTAVK